MSGELSTRTSKVLNNLTECSACGNSFSNPRLLPCIHTYCLECIEHFTRGKIPGDSVACPLCMKTFLVPDAGVSDLPKNCFTEQLIRSTNIISRRCEGCNKTEDDVRTQKQSVVWCVECKLRFCEDCVDVHGRATNTREHKLVNIDNGNELATVGNMMVACCHKHPNEVLSEYCFACDEALCAVCCAQIHHAHQRSDVNELIKDFSKQITNDIKKMNETVSKCHDIAKEHTVEMNIFSSSVERIAEEICARAEQLKKLIDLEKLKLLHELASYKRDRMKQMQQLSENVEKHALFASDLTKYMEELRNMGIASIMAQQAKCTHDRVDELTKIDHIQREIKNVHLKKVAFAAAEIPIKCFIGTVTCQQVNGNPNDFSLFLSI